MDIDAGSAHHSKSELDRLLEVLALAGLGRSTLYRSSFSGGWHLYLFFEEAVRSAELYRNLHKLLSLNNFQVAKGSLEVFPNPGQGSMGMGLRLPLQQGFAWLNKQDLEVEHERETLSATKALELFLDVLDSDANPIESVRLLKERVRELELARVHEPKSETVGNVVPLRKTFSDPANEHSIFVAAAFKSLPSGIDSENWIKGRQFHIGGGLTGAGQRAEAIHSLGHYFFYGDPTRDLPALGYGFEDDREWAIAQFIEAHHNGHSKDLNRGRADATAQVTRAAQWRPAHRRSDAESSYLPVRPISWDRENANRRSDARRRIQAAKESLKRYNRTFTTVELQQAAGCSRATLYNHQDIWRQDYEDLAADFFAACTDEYNAVESSELVSSDPVFPRSEVLQTPEVFVVQDKAPVPAGLIQARRVVQALVQKVVLQVHSDTTAAEKLKNDLDEKWRDKIKDLTRKIPSELEVPEIKSVLFVLTNYLSVAPYEEDATLLAVYIGQLRNELKRQTRGPVPPS